MIKDNKQAIHDAIGLTKAYEDGDTHIIGNTMYIAGTHTKRDAYDDITKVPSVFTGCILLLPNIKALWKLHLWFE